MQDKVFSLLGLATKAGKVVSGEFSVENAVKSGEAALVILAGDSSENTSKKFKDKCKFYNIPIRFYGTKDALGAAMGKESRATAAVMDEGFANTILRRLEE